MLSVRQFFLYLREAFRLDTRDARTLLSVIHSANPAAMAQELDQATAPATPPVTTDELRANVTRMRLVHGGRR